MAEGKKPKRWMAKATENAHGQFRKKAESAGESTHEFAEEHRGDSDKTGKQARLALVLMGSNHKHSKASKGSLYKNRD